MTAPTDELMEEHRVIERMLEILSKASDRLASGRDVDPELYVQAVDFLQNFADKCHHGKEEKLLFEKMIEKGVSGEVGPIAVMLREHQDGRAHVKRMAELSRERMTERTMQAMIESSRAYVDLLSKHIQKEDSVLYPLANQLLEQPDQEELEEGFRDVEEKVMGSGANERYHHMIDAWESKYC